MLNSIAKTYRDELLLLARLSFMILFLIAGWEHATNFSGTVAYFTKIGVPMPMIATIVSILVEIPIAFAVISGWYTRPSLILLIMYTLGTAYFGHQFWEAPSATRTNIVYHFYKNISICAGFLALFLTGPGRYSVDAARERRSNGALAAGD